MASHEKEPQFVDELSSRLLALGVVWALMCGIGAYRGLTRMELSPPGSYGKAWAPTDRLEVSRVCLVPGDAARCEVRVRVPAGRGPWRVAAIDEQGRTMGTIGLIADGKETRWDGRSQGGQFLAPGIYLIVARQPDTPTSAPLAHQWVRVDPTPPGISITEVQVSDYYRSADEQSYGISIEGNLTDPPPVVPWSAHPLLAVQWRPLGEPDWRSERHAYAWGDKPDPSKFRGGLAIPAHRVRGYEVEIRVTTADSAQDVISSPPYRVRLSEKEN